jgi:hypothetical protein
VRRAKLAASEARAEKSEDALGKERSECAALRQRSAGTESELQLLQASHARLEEAAALTRQQLADAMNKNAEQVTKVG